MTRRTIVVAPDKFKGSLSARAVGRAIERGLKHVAGERYTIDVVPMADGGEGTVDAFLDGGALGVRRTVRGPLGAPVEATLAHDGDVVVLEMASASGLALLPAGTSAARDASTYGTGELVRAALELGASRIVIGIGGSATNDGGAGMLEALGARFYNAAGERLRPGGINLADLAGIDVAGLDPRLRRVELEVAADVDNPLCGAHGASAVFGPQKGASPEDVRRLDAALATFADVAARVVGRDYRNAPGAGAAGGLGFGFIAFLGAHLRPGVHIVAELRGLVAALRGASLCISGEGRIDAQTLHGKTVAGVAEIARGFGVPVIALAGTLEADAEDELFARGITCFPVVDKPLTLGAAIADAEKLVEHAASRIARALAATWP